MVNLYQGDCLEEMGKVADHSCTCQQKLDTKLKKLGIKIEYLYKIQ